MAKLICADGTEIAISKETEQNLRKQFGKKKGFKPIKSCHLTISVGKDEYLPVNIEMLRRDIGIYTCEQTLEQAKQTIKAIQSAIDYIKDK